MTVRNYHAYCDESGNTGANLLDPDQPLLLVGGWLVNDGVIELAEQVVREYVRLLKPHDNELHGAQVLRSEFGTRNVLNLMHDLNKLYCAPICQIIKKRFLLVGHIFEVFMNPRSNPNIPYSFEDMYETKREYSEIIYSLPNEVLAEFAEAYDTLSRPLLVDSLRNITTALGRRSETHLVDLMLGSLPNVETIIDYINRGRLHFDAITLNTPNVASFHMFIHFLEHVGRMADIPTILLVHDEILQFSGTFRMIFEECRDDGRNDVFREGPWSYVFRGFESLKDLRFADSKNEPLLQAADVFISAIYRYATNIYKDDPNSAALTEIARLFIKEPPPYPVVIRNTTSYWFAEKLRNSV